MHNDVLEVLDDSNLTVHVIWLPVMGSDTRASVEQARLTMLGARTHHYWDDDISLGFTFGKIVDLPNGDDLAWDVYFVYNRGTKWSGRPEAPDSWWHQLRGDDHHRLSTAKLREYLESALAE